MGKRLFVDNCPNSATSASLTALFQGAGTVESATLSSDHRTGQFEGFAFIEMATEEEAEAAIQKYNGTRWEGNTLTVTFAGPAAARVGFHPKDSHLRRKKP